MRIDPSQLSEPLAHVLGGGAVDAAGGQRAAADAARVAPEAQFEQLDQLLLKRLRASAVADAANSVISYQDAQARIDRIRELTAQDPSSARGAQGALDPSRVRGLLDG